MILVAGGTGRLGTKVVGLLLQRRLEVRVVTRDRSRAAHLAGTGVDIVEGDVRNLPAVLRAVAGARTVVSAIQGFAGTKDGNPATIDRDGNRNLILAAREAGVEHFVLVSVKDASPDHPAQLMRMKYAAEQDLKTSGLAWTIIRPTAHPAMRGDVIEVGGPDNLTMTAFVDAFRKEIGSSGNVGHISPPAMRLMGLVMSLVNPALARQIQMGVIMDTRPQAFDASDTRRRYPSIPVTSLNEVVRRDYAAARGLVHGSPSDAHA